MAAKELWNWRSKVSIPEVLLAGDTFDRYDDETNTMDIACPVRVDEFGFYLVWEPKGKDVGTLDITQVWEARPSGTAKDARVLYELEQKGKCGPSGETLEERTVWLTYSQDLVIVNGLFLIARSAQVAKEWRAAINEYICNQKFRNACPMQCLQKHWRSICLATNDRGRIPLRNIVRTFSSGKPEKMVHKCCADLGLSGDKEREDLEVGLFTFEKFLRLYHKICPRTDVQELFVRLSGQKEYLTRERLLQFLNEEQRDPRLNEILFPHFDHERVQQIIAKYESDESYIAQGKMSGDGFLRFLLSEENSPVFQDRSELFQDMDQPLCHYFINSSHNTYLTGRQYGGKSSTEIYRQVLLSGCRCIELDCWDGTGENKGEPIITHGKAMCTDVFFKEVLYQIKESAFSRSDFPVILSFENHCSKSNQLKMAKYCLEILGDMLLSKPLDDHLLEPGVPLPSPNRLRRKILIKNKRLKKEEERRQMEALSQGRLLDEEEEMSEEMMLPMLHGGQSLAHDSAGEECAIVGKTSSSPPPLSSDQRAHPEEEDAAALNSPNSLFQPPPPKPRLGPTTSSASFSTGELPISAYHRPSISNAPSRQNSSAALSSHQGENSEEAHKAPTFMSKLKQPLGLSKKVQPALTKEEEERLFKMIQESYHYQGATTNIHPLLSSLVNYTHPVKFSGFDIAESNDLHFHMSSFSESTGLGLLKQSALEFVNYNKRQLSRIYPKGARVDSSNFLPQIFWNAGCQMVALNFQTPDVCMQLNQGKFEYNGQCGYLLKPDFMRRPDRTFDPFSESPVDGVIAAHCSVRIISGQFLCERKTGTYVEVEMYGLPTDTIRKEHRTKLVPGNGLNPIYNEEPFVFRKVILPELAVLRFAVYDENGKQLGQRILLLDGLQSGYRHISLRTDNNQPMTLPTLFVHIQLKTYVPDELSGLVDALADPRAYLSAQEKREEALHQMGVDDELDMVGDEVPVAMGQGGSMRRTKQQLLGESHQFESNASIRRCQNGSMGTPMGSVQQMGAIDRANAASSPLPGAKDGSALVTGQSPRTVTLADGQQHLDAGKFQVEWIHITDLRKDKAFLKLQKRLQKDMEEMKRRHQKMRESVQRQQQSSVNKLVDQSQKLSLKKRSHQNCTSLNVERNNGGANHGPLAGRISDPTALPQTEISNEQQKIRSLVQSQTDEWSQLLRRLEQEEFEQHKGHIREEYALLRRLLAEKQKQQMTSMSLRFEAEDKELKQAQTKKSIEDNRVVHQDKNVKTKAERDRRVKELNEKNVKLFMEERRRLATKCDRHKQQLEKRHSEQSETLEKEAAKAMELEEMNHRESLLASQPQCIV